MVLSLCMLRNGFGSVLYGSALLMYSWSAVGFIRLVLKFLFMVGFIYMQEKYVIKWVV